jgi:hypothetical protein
MGQTPLDIYHLEQDRKYVVRQTFQDFYHGQFHKGEVLTFVEFNFLPYHGGYTVIFREKKLYLQEEENARILDSLGEYLEPAEI